MDILRRHTKFWRGQWKADDKDMTTHTAKTIKEARDRITQEKVEEEDDEDYSAEEIRRAARTFKSSTSIGIDLWTFREIAPMPDIILNKLGKMLKKVKKEQPCRYRITSISWQAFRRRQEDPERSR